MLVVDDDYDTCEHACLLLDKMGLRTRWVLSGAEAVKVVQESHVSGDGYDVCFIDWKMPDMDGMETVRRIRNEVGPETLIIIISAYDWGAIEEKARAIGVNGFIAKPFFRFQSLQYAYFINTAHGSEERNRSFRPAQIRDGNCTSAL